jgi:hypothetical protein
VTWDQVVTWLIIPGGVALFLGIGALWLAKHTP